MAECQLGEVGVNTVQLEGRFSDIRPLGYGSGGLVYSAEDKQAKRRVCIKKLAFLDQRSCQKVLREVRILHQLSHDNIVTLHEVLDASGTRLTADSARSPELKAVFFVQDFLQTDLNQLIHSRQLGTGHIQLLMYQLLRGLKYLHSANVLHRDLKPSNLFVNCDTLLLKIGDFGTSRILDPTYKHAGHLTSHVGTCWYMSPEALLLSPKDYTRATDLWSTGCIVAECFLGTAVFQGAHELDQMLRIIDSIHLTDLDWTKVFRVMPNKLLKNQPLRPRTPLRCRLHGVDALALDFIESLLTFDPKSRLSATEALQHPYFSHYACDHDEPIADKPFHIEHEVDDLPVSTLRNMLIKECCLASGRSLSSSHEVHMPSRSSSVTKPAEQASSEPRREETHTLEEIFQTTSPADLSGIRRVQDINVDNAWNSCVHGDTESVQLENLRNIQPLLGVNIFHINKKTNSDVFRKTAKDHNEDEEKDVADCSPRKIREDLELGMNELLSRTQLLAVNMESAAISNERKTEGSQEVLTIKIDQTENYKEYSQPSPKSTSPRDAACAITTGSNNNVGSGLRIRGHVTSAWGAIGRTNISNQSREHDSNKEEFSKKRLKAEATSTLSRKLILDKIETEKSQHMVQSRHHSGLTSEEFDELYRLPTDHLNLNRDFSNQSLKNKHVKNNRSRRAVQPWHCQDREKFKEELYLEGACGGYEQSPEHSDHSDEDLLQNATSENACIVPTSTAHSTYDIDISLSVLPMASLQQNHAARDPLSSPESPPSPGGGRSGARPKKSPKKQRAL